MLPNNLEFFSVQIFDNDRIKFEQVNIGGNKKIFFGKMRDLIIKNNSNSNNLNSSSIIDFLNSQTIKIIPDYQRPYTWDENNVEELFDDILHSAKNNSKWFLGPLFTSHRDQDFNELELLDGQQRITTIILFLRCYSSLFLSEHYAFTSFDADVTESEEK